MPLRSTSLKTDDRHASPDAFGPFRVLHQIGTGTLGPVFRAYDPTRDRLVAIKLFQIGLVGARLDQFVEKLQQLIDRHTPHPAIPTPIATGIAGSSAFLAQEFVAATSADAALRQHGPMPLAHVLRAAAQVAEAIDSPVGREALHGTLHPRDVLVGADEVRVTGFGLARALEPFGLGALVRPPYTAPERTRGAAWDHRADIFSLAAIVAELLTGVPVTPSGRVALDRLPDLTGSHRLALGRALARALAIRPDERFDYAADFVAELQAAEATPDPDASRFAEVPWVASDLPSVLTSVGGDAATGDVVLRTGLMPDAALTWDAPIAAVKPEPSLRHVAAGHEAVSPQLPLVAEETPLAQVALDAPGDTASIDDGATSLAVLSGGAADASRSALWPLSLALVVGLVVGAAVGFITFITRGTTAPTTEAGLSAPAPRTAPTGLVAYVAPPTTSERAVIGAGAASQGLTPPPDRAPARNIAKGDLGGGSARRVEDTARGGPVGTTNRFEPVRADSAGRVLVRSLPAGARVLLNGTDVGSTPVPLRSIPFGTHTVRVVQDGYQPAERRVVLTPVQPSESLIVDLRPARAGSTTDLGGTPVRSAIDGAPARAGGGDAPPAAAAASKAGLVVESRPSGATVFLNDRRLGTTPLSTDAVAPGSHAIRLELDGYRRWSSSILVAAGARHRVAASLEH